MSDFPDFEVVTVQDFAEIEQEFMERIARVVWCSVATIDTKNRPRSRVLHPIWEGTTGWINVYRDSLKGKHLAHNPHVSIAYVGEPFKPVYIEGLMAWEDHLDEKKRVWELFKSIPEPLGYDPTPVFISPDHPNYGLLKIIPRQIVVYTLAQGKKIWNTPA